MRRSFCADQPLRIGRRWARMRHGAQRDFREKTPMPSEARTPKFSRRRLLQAGSGGLAAILATGRAPVFAQAQPKKLDFAHILPPPDSGGIAFDWMAKEVTSR